MVLTLEEAASRPLAEVGGKASALGRLMGFGALVPPGFVVTPGSDLDATVERAFDVLKRQFVAVRSSAAGEDAPGQSWAGQFESYLYVVKANLLDRIRDCRQSGRSDRAKAYSPSVGDMPVAVIVQAMVASDVAGVLFTANPVTQNRDQIVVEAVYGLGEQLVQGLATPDNYLIDKSSGQVTHQTLSTKTVMLVGSETGLEERLVPSSIQHEPALSRDQCAQLSQLAVSLERQFGHPLDIEFAYEQGKLCIVQARPITTLS